jgi:hypothetical protein
MLPKHLATCVKVFLTVPPPIPQSLNQRSIPPRPFPHVPSRSRHHPAAPDVAVRSVRSERTLSHSLCDVIDADARFTSHSPPMNRGESVAIRVGVLLV